jgi:hypothetical protein
MAHIRAAYRRNGNASDPKDGGVDVEGAMSRGVANPRPQHQPRSRAERYYYYLFLKAVFSNGFRIGYLGSHARRPGRRSWPRTESRNGSSRSRARIDPFVNISELRSRFPHTFPVWPVNEEGRCTCGDPSCRRPGKHASEFAPADSPIYAVLCGPKPDGSGVLVIDVDTKGGVKKNGFAQLKGWEITETFEVKTPSGGAHLYYLHPGGELANRKLDSAIDTRVNAKNDGGWSYVVGPGSPGYVKTSDPCVVKPAKPYTVVNDAPFAATPPLVGAFLSIDSAKESEPVTPITEDDSRWSEAHELGVEVCKTYEPSREDGSASTALCSLSHALVCQLQLPVDAALEIALEHWNPRCTKSDGISESPWEEGDIRRAFVNAQQKGYGKRRLNDVILERRVAQGIERMRSHARAPNATPPPPSAEPKSEKTKIGAGYENDGERKKLSRSAVASMLYRWPDWDGVLWFDVLARKPLAIDPPLEGRLTMQDGAEPDDADLAEIALWFDAQGYLVSKEQVKDGVKNVIRKPDRQRNELAEYLDSLGGRQRDSCRALMGPRSRKAPRRSSVRSYACSHSSSSPLPSRSRP